MAGITKIKYNSEIGIKYAWVDILVFKSNSRLWDNRLRFHVRPFSWLEKL